MAFITDPDNLTQGVEVTIDTTNRLITLNSAGNLGDVGTLASSNGVTHQALYSFLKEEWRSDPTLIPFPFPITAITPEQFEWINDWEPADDATRNLIRTGGWREVATGATTPKREYLGIISLGNIDAGDTPYFFFSSQSSATSFDFDGPVNQAIQTYEDGYFDYRNDVLTVSIRIFGKTYGKATTVDIGISSGDNLVSQVARFPLSEADDLNILALVTTNVGDLFDDIVTTPVAPYDNISIEYFATPQLRTGFNPLGSDSIAGETNFGVVIDADIGSTSPASTTQIYAYVQAQLTTSVDIDAGATSVIGQLADPLLQFVGSTLETLNISENPAGAGGLGVAIDNFDTNDTNDLVFRDNDLDSRSFPFVAAGVISFNDNLQNDASAVYRMFYTTTPGNNNFGTSNALIVQDNEGFDISGNVSGSSTIAFSYDFDGNTQGGRVPPSAPQVTVVAIGLATAQYVVAQSTITRSTGQNISLVAALERNYSNP